MIHIKKTFLTILLLIGLISAWGQTYETKRGTQLTTATSTSATDYYIMLQNGTTKKVLLGTMYTNPAFSGTIFLGSDTVATLSDVRSADGTTYYPGYGTTFSNDSVSVDSSKFATTYDMSLKANIANPAFTGTAFIGSDTISTLADIRDYVASNAGEVG